MRFLTLLIGHWVRESIEVTVRCYLGSPWGVKCVGEGEQSLLCWLVNRARFSVLGFIEISKGHFLRLGCLIICWFIHFCVCLCAHLCVQHHVRPSRVPGGVQSQSGTDAGQHLLWISSSSQVRLCSWVPVRRPRFYPLSTKQLILQPDRLHTLQNQHFTCATQKKKVVPRKFRQYLLRPVFHFPNLLVQRRSQPSGAGRWRGRGERLLC